MVDSFNIVPYLDDYKALVTWHCKRGVVTQMGIFALNGSPERTDILKLG